MDYKLLKQLGFSEEFIEHVKNFPQYQSYEKLNPEINSLQVVQYIKDDLIINSPGLDFNDLRLQNFRSSANVI